MDRAGGRRAGGQRGDEEGGGARADQGASPPARRSPFNRSRQRVGASLDVDPGS
jgi:hypothetical protein